MNGIVYVAGAALAGMVAVAGSSALAQAYPVKPIRIIVPFPPGGMTDFLARTLGPRLSESLREQVVVENRAGATGNIGADAAAKSAPDGYTLLIGQASNIAINITLMGKLLPYDPVRDFTPVTLFASTPNVQMGPSVACATTWTGPSPAPPPAGCHPQSAFDPPDPIPNARGPVVESPIL